MDGSGFLNLAHAIDCTDAEGPGRRFCFWVQGCLRACPGCCNPHMRPLVPRLLVPVRDAVAAIDESRAKHGIEGVTFLGGEPLLQAKGLSFVAAHCRAAGLTVFVFTGFTLEECRLRPLPGVPELLANTDVLVDGPFLRERFDDSRNWIGSSNQRFHYFTAAYDSSIETDPAYRGQVEFRATLDGWRANGCPRTLSECLSHVQKTNFPCQDPN